MTDEPTLPAVPHGMDHTSPDDPGAGPAPVRLPADVDRAAAGPNRAAVEELALPERTHKALGRVATELAVPETVLALTAWILVLHRHTGRRDLVLDVCAERSVETAEARPLAVTVEPDDSFAGFAARVRETLAEPSPPPSSGQGPGSAPVRAHLYPRGTKHRSSPSRAMTVAEVEFAMSALEERSTFHLTYQSGLFEPATAVALLNDCSALLTMALSAPYAPAHTHRMRPPLSGAPSPWELPLPPGFSGVTEPGETECLVDRFREVTARFADHLAVSGPSGTYRYADLDAESTALARRLIGTVPRGAHIALLAEHDVGLAVGVWSVLKAGCAYVPLDPRHPNGRLVRMVNESAVAAVLCDTSSAERAEVIAKGRPVVTLTADTTDAPTAPGTLPEGAPHSPAYLLHTSGTTGRPKAVVQTRRNVLAHAVAYADRIGIGPGENVSLLPRISSDAAVMDLFAAHLTGASLHLIDPHASAGRLRAAVDRAAVSVLHCTPTLLRHLCSDASDAPDEGFEELARVWVVVLGGEEATSGDLRLFRRAFPEDCHLVNGLGPTECTIALQHLARPEDLLRPSLPAGHPVDGVSVRLLDDRQRPTDVFGELEIVSDRVALGYWNDDTTTTAVFSRPPDGPASYRTGDLMRRLPDGRLVFCGRKDRQIKIRGYRVEPDEVQTVLRAHPSVGQAVVEVDRSSPAGPRLVGYVTSATPMPADGEELLGYLRRSLPEHAVPWQIVVLGALPVGLTGKVDRSRLPVPAPDRPATTDDAPRSPLERDLASLWCEVLGIATVGIHTDWMRCGGDSLQLIALLDRVKEKWAADVPVLDFLRGPTVAALAGLVEQRAPQALLD